MNVLIWSACIIIGAIISYNLFNINVLKTCVITTGLMILILPVAAQFDGGSDER